MFQIKRTCTDSFEVNFFMVNHACMTEVNIFKDVHIVHPWILIFIQCSMYFIVLLWFPMLCSKGFYCYQLLKFSELKIPGSIFRCICLSNIKLSGMHYLKKNLPGSPSRSHVLLRRGRVQLGEDVDDQGVDQQHPPPQPPCHPATC